MIRAVFFDVGGTILDETREFATWADWLGVPRHTFSAVFGAVIARGLDYQEVFRAFRPDFDLTAELARRVAAGDPESFGAEDLYPDARACLAALREQGLRVGLAGNQPEHAEATLRALDLPVDVIGTSAAWGVAKPAPEFFAAVVAAAGLPAARIVHVGDSPEYDVAAAQRAGLRAVWLNRAGLPRPRGLEPDGEVSTLAELPTTLITVMSANA